MATLTPVFLVMVAIVCPQDMNDIAFDKMLQEQAFYSDKPQALAGNFRVVYGVNCEKAKLDTTLVQKFNDLPDNAFGFTWCQAKKQYLFQQEFVEAKYADCQDSPARFVPMRGVREVIKNSEIAQRFVRELSQIENSVVYLVTMDADALDLKSSAGRDSEGILTQFRNTIVKFAEKKKNKYPRMVSCGFRVSQTVGELSYPSIKLAVELDMRIRKAQSENDPYLVYFPEPASAFLLPSGETESQRLQKLNFFGTVNADVWTKHEDGGAENAILKRSIKLLEDPNETGGGDFSINTEPGVFDNTLGGVVTAIPQRLLEAATPGTKPMSVENLLKEIIELPMLDIAPGSRATSLLSLIAARNKKTFETAMTQLFSAYDPISCIIDPKDLSFDVVVAQSDVTALLDLRETQKARAEVAKQTINTQVNQDGQKMVFKVARDTGNAVLKFLNEEIKPNSNLFYIPEGSPFLAELEEAPTQSARTTKHAHHRKQMQAVMRRKRSLVNL